MTTLDAIPSTTQTADPTTHRPVALSAPADLLHLRAQALRAARDKIDLHLPPHANTSTSPSQPSTAGGGAESASLRLQVERRLDAYIETLFAGVRANVAANGLPGPDAVSWSPDAADKKADAFEPYDAALAGRLVELHARLETLRAESADARRTRAGAAAQAFEADFAAWNEGLDGVERAEGRRVADAASSKATDGSTEGLKVPFAGREERVAASFEAGVAQLAGLGRKMAESRARAAEAAKVVEYFAQADAATSDKDK